MKSPRPAQRDPAPMALTSQSLSSQNRPTNLSPDKQREMLRRMLTIRRFEEGASADYLAGKIYGVVHCYIGEEAVAGGGCPAPGRGGPVNSTPPGPRPRHPHGARPNPPVAQAYRRP